MKNELLELNETTDDQIVIIREFNAPIKLVFEALTQHEHIMKWNCPNSMKVTFSEGDLKVGSTYRYGMQSLSGSGPEMILTGEFKEIDEPTKLIYTQVYQMPDGNTSPETTISITLEEDNDKTQMIFHHSGLMQGRDQARGGWEQALAKLDTVISSLV